MRRGPVRRTSAAAALVLGALQYGVFWLGPVLDRDLSIIGSHGLQLVYYGLMILMLGFGLWQAARALPEGNGRKLATVGAVLAILGELSFIGVWTAGLLIVGLSAAAGGPYRLPRIGLFAGSSLWLVLLFIGERFDSDDSAPLTDVGRWLSTSGLLMIVVSLVLWGLASWNALRRTNSHESVLAT